MPLCHTAPLLPSVTQQRNVTEYCQEGSASTAIPPTLTSDVMGQHNKIGGITFRANLIETMDSCQGDQRHSVSSLPDFG